MGKYRRYLGGFFDDYVMSHWMSALGLLSFFEVCLCVCVHVFVFMSVLFSQVIWLPACSAPNSGVPNGAPTASHA